MILGTAAYMSPEQAKGRDGRQAQRRWAFGCVLYEMLTGRRAFEGEDVTRHDRRVVRADHRTGARCHQTVPPLDASVSSAMSREGSESDASPDIVDASFAMNESLTTLSAAPSCYLRRRDAPFLAAARCRF